MKIFVPNAEMKKMIRNTKKQKMKRNKGFPYKKLSRRTNNSKKIAEKVLNNPNVKTCRQCGQILKENALFCEKCNPYGGSPLDKDFEPIGDALERERGLLQMEDE